MPISGGDEEGYAELYFSIGLTAIGEDIRHCERLKKVKVVSMKNKPILFQLRRRFNIREGQLWVRGKSEWARVGQL